MKDEKNNEIKNDGTNRQRHCSWMPIFGHRVLNSSAVEVGNDAVRARGLRQKTSAVIDAVNSAV